ncbi:hypothetical protein [Roseimicrobium sp. ORNL1]|uniref:hypothetical protein n=1 Tax=Roseimicrobium sp. ORNL1 TaxID=2711231 RepID=UPI0013E1CF89|nr:hypothetical protein [Roseimicrobium sp. ORNL1]QIF03786.1 hypothetical protein G5S37_20425 [Roseimicrobium sp. ORNL1]
MMKTPTKFLWSDAWLLMSVYFAGPRGSVAPLEHVIGAGDYINHSIFTVSELNGGFSRLQRAGLIAVHEHGFSITPAGEELVTPSSKKRLRVLKHMHDIREQLGAEAWKPGLNPNETDDPERTTTYVTEVSVHEAFNAYLKNLKRKKKKK